MHYFVVRKLSIVMLIFSFSRNIYPLDLGCLVLNHLKFDFASFVIVSKERRSSIVTEILKMEL